MNDLPLLSANFKRDYVATSAIVLFVMIVIAEVTLAIAIPTYLYRENAMAIEVRQDKLLTSFDLARSRCGKVKAKPGSVAEMELRLISWNLDGLATYMRGERKNLTDDEITQFQKAVDNANDVMTKIEQGGSYSYEEQLNTARYVNSLLKNGE